MATATQTKARTLVKTETPGWYLDPSTGKKARRRKVDKVISADEFERAMDGERAGAKIFVSDTGKALIGPTTTIKCEVCQAERVVKVQDRFQVKRCVEHQRAHRNALKREKRAKAKASK